VLAAPNYGILPYLPNSKLGLYLVQSPKFVYLQGAQLFDSVWASEICKIRFFGPIRQGQPEISQALIGVPKNLESSGLFFPGLLLP